MTFEGYLTNISIAEKAEQTYTIVMKSQVEEQRGANRIVQKCILRGFPDKVWMFSQPWGSSEEPVSTAAVRAAVIEKYHRDHATQSQGENGETLDIDFLDTSAFAGTQSTSTSSKSQLIF